MARKITHLSDAGKVRRVALFTPLPPAETGTADYAEALTSELAKLVDLQVFERVPIRFKPDGFDALVYQIGNNQYHAEAYELALKYPGVVVLHETNLHDLIRGLIGGDETAYFREVIYEVFGRELEQLPDPRILEPGPQPRAFRMMRRLLSRSKGCIVHSRFAADEVRRAGFRGQLCQIPHGSQIQRLDGAVYRNRLGIGSHQPVIGMFGYQRPDKLVCDCLLTFKNLVQRLPDARLLIAGKPHPEVPVEDRIASLGLQGKVHVMGFQPLSGLDGLIAGCDVVLNLRSPTFGETSGTMMRAFGLGKTVVVSNNGSSRELPDDICAKIPVDEFQDRVLEECLFWLLSDREITTQIGLAAQQWVSDTCTWERAARSYAEFLFPPRQDLVSPAFSVNGHHSKFLRDYLVRWVVPESPAWRYLSGNLNRLVRTLELIPRAADDCRILEMGCYLQLTPALRNLIGYGEVRGCYQGTGGSEMRVVQAQDGEAFKCEIDLFDAEADQFPYLSNYFDTVLCCEILAHLTQDPMRMMSEIHRILKPGGILLLTTPNAASLHAIFSALNGNQPAFYNRYPRPPQPSPESRLARHVREYTPAEIASLLCNSGFILTRMETTGYTEHRFAEFESARDLLVRCGRSVELRDDCIFAVAMKAALPKNRYPSWLYDD
jgi:glycosyltransferase involved in cell wall biosynthesis/SAM-dependent methyltransferase